MAWIDELERDLGAEARQRLIAVAGGQRRDVPRPGSALTSKLASEAGPEVALWLARHFGGEQVDVPSARGREAEDRANSLRAAILDAGLDAPARSANAIAAEFKVTSAYVRKLRAQLRASLPDPVAPLRRQLSLFDE